ncbi:MAG: hypothetical protein H6582_01410 [Crocinitomicaceae bacterium]|nr:hypothetical protein [Crocinitomicaceae bacterium]
MKKLFVLVLAVGALVVTTTSCKKEWTCECTVLGFTGDTTLTDISKSDAKDYCDSQDAAASLFGGSCKLK